MCSGLLRLRATGCHLPHPQKVVHGRKSNKVRCLLVKISHCQAKRKLTRLAVESLVFKAPLRCVEWVVEVYSVACVNILKNNFGVPKQALLCFVDEGIEASKTMAI